MPHAVRLTKVALVIITCLFAVFGTGCSSAPVDDSSLTAAELYAEAQSTIRSANWDQAIKNLRRVQARFPFDPYAIQAHLDMIFVHQEQGDVEAVIEECDRFIKENPRHPRVDYAYYMRGVAYFPKQPFFLNKWFGLDPADTDTSGAERSFQYLRRLVEAFPQSEYIHDARARMTWLQNHMARHELGVAMWYMRREAYVAAIARSRGLLEDYPDSDSKAQALEIMVLAYRKIGMDDLAVDTKRMLETNYPGYRMSLTFKPRNERWLDWVRDFFD